MRGMMDDRETEHDARVRRTHPLRLERPALRADGRRRMPEMVTSGAALKAQFPLLAVVPEHLVVNHWSRSRNLGREVCHRQTPKIAALNGEALAPAVTKQISASLTWDVDSPRSCRTPSTTKFNP